MIAIAQITDLRASWAVGTVKKRIRMCGIPAVPNTSAMPSEIWSIGALKQQTRLEEALAELARRHVLRRVTQQQRNLRLHLGIADHRCAGRRAELKPYGVQTSITSRIDAVTSRIALMICTHVVATIPPNST